MLAQVGESITAESDLRSHRLNHRSPGNIPRQPSGSPPFNPLQWNSVAISPLDFTFEPPATSRIRGHGGTLLILCWMSRWAPGVSDRAESAVPPGQGRQAADTRGSGRQSDSLRREQEPFPHVVLRPEQGYCPLQPLIQRF